MHYTPNNVSTRPDFGGMYYTPNVGPGGQHYTP